MSKQRFERLLRELDEDELREELRQLYRRFPALREYYTMELADSTKAVLDKYKKQLRKAFFPARGRGKRARSVSRKIIKDFREVAIHPRDVVELYFYRAELMAEHIRAFRTDSDAYHDSAVKAFEEAARQAQKEFLLDTFADGARQLTDYFTEVRRNRHFSFEPTLRQYWT